MSKVERALTTVAVAAVAALGSLLGLSLIGPSDARPVPAIQVKQWDPASERPTRRPTRTEGEDRAKTAARTVSPERSQPAAPARATAAPQRRAAESSSAREEPSDDDGARLVPIAPVRIAPVPAHDDAAETDPDDEPAADNPSGVGEAQEPQDAGAPDSDDG
jgi:hypothetical protein